MRLDFDEDWKFWLVVGAIGLAILLVVGTIFSVVAGLFVFLFRGIGFILGTIFRFAFSSIAGFAILIIGAYLSYQGYKRLNRGETNDEKTVEYTDEDFSR